MIPTGALEPGSNFLTDIFCTVRLVQDRKGGFQHDVAVSEIRVHSRRLAVQRHSQESATLAVQQSKRFALQCAEKFKLYQLHGCLKIRFAQKK